MNTSYKEYQQEYQRKYRATHKEKQQEYQREYRATHKEKPQLNTYVILIN